MSDNHPFSLVLVLVLVRDGVAGRLEGGDEGVDVISDIFSCIIEIIN